MQPSPLFSHNEDLTSDPTSATVVVDDTKAGEDSRGRIDVSQYLCTVQYVLWARPA